MAPGARSKFGAPMFEPELFRKQMYCTEESTCDSGTFWCPPVIWRPHSDSAPGKLYPSLGPLRYAPDNNKSLTGRGSNGVIGTRNEV